MALRTLWKTQTPCRSDPIPSRWYTERSGNQKLWDETHAKGVCRTECPHRALCAAWAFEMEDYWVWAGYTAVERRWLKSKHPALVEEMVMLIKSLINTSDGLGGRLRPGTVRDVPESHAALLVRRGLAERVEAVMEELDAALSEHADVPEELSEEATFHGEQSRDAVDEEPEELEAAMVLDDEIEEDEYP